MTHFGGRAGIKYSRLMLYGAEKTNDGADERKLNRVVVEVAVMMEGVVVCVVMVVCPWVNVCYYCTVHAIIFFFYYLRKE